MEDVLDAPSNEINRTNIKYGGFWQRFGALIIDGFILAPISFGVTYFNIVSWKSSVVLILATVISTAYKPFLEYNYGATWGKMAVKVKVTNLELEKASLSEILLRNIFHILPAVITLLLTLQIYVDPDFESITGFMEYSAFTQKFTALQYANIPIGLIVIVDAIVLLADQQKRSLHDKIAGTLVIDES